MQVKCHDWDFSRLGGAHRLEEGVDVAHKVAEVSVGPRVLQEELAANHLAADAGGVAPVAVDPAPGNAKLRHWKLRKLQAMHWHVGVMMREDGGLAAHCPSSMLRGTDQLPSPRKFALKPSQYSMTKTHGSVSASSSCRGPIVASVMAATAAMASSEDQEGPATRRGGGSVRAQATVKLRMAEAVHSAVARALVPVSVSSGVSQRQLRAAGKMGCASAPAVASQAAHISSPFSTVTAATPTSPPARRSTMHCNASSVW